jgi:hypothetical protein
MLAQDATTTTYTFQTVKYPGDPYFTQLLGINNNDVIAGYHGGSQNSMDPNNGFTLVLPDHFTSEDYPKSIQTQVTAINDQTPTKTVGFYIAECGDSTCNHGFEYAAGVYTTVDFPGQPFNQLLGQNDKRQESVITAPTILAPRRIMLTFMMSVGTRRAPPLVSLNYW